MIVGKKRDIRVQHKPTRVSKDPRDYVMSTFICKKCGYEMNIFRDIKKRRNKGHIKTMYCPKCQKVTIHDEIRDIDHVRNYEEPKQKVRVERSKKHETSVFSNMLDEFIEQNPGLIQGL